MITSQTSNYTEGQQHWRLWKLSPTWGVKLEECKGKWRVKNDCRRQPQCTRQDTLKKAECHLAEVLKQNGYPSSFTRSSSVPSRRNVEVTEAPLLEGGRRLPLVMLPYTEGVSEDIRRVCRKFGLKVVFRSGLSLRSMLTRVKDTLGMEKRSKVVWYTKSRAAVARSTLGRQ